MGAIFHRGGNMAIKRMVDIGFWTDDKVVEVFSPEDKYFMLYLLTNPHTTQLGIYQVNKKVMAFETGYSIETIVTLIDRFQNKYKLIHYNRETNEIGIINFLKHSIVKGGKPVEDLLIKELGQVKDTKIIDNIFENIEKYPNLNATVKRVITLYKLKENDNDNDNDVSYHDSYHDSYDDSLVVVEKPKSDKKSINEIIDEYTSNPKLIKALNEFIEHRNTYTKTKISPLGLTKNLNQLDQLFTNDEDKIKSIDQTIANNWKGVFPLKDDNKSGKKDPIQMMKEGEWLL
jgi:hypothetical protein